MSDSRLRQGQAATGDFDPLGMHWHTLREEIAGGDLEAANRVARNLVICLQVIFDGANAIRQDYVDFHEKYEEIAEAEAQGDSEGALAAERLMDEWDSHLLSNPSKAHRHQLKRFAWQLAGFHWRWRTQGGWSRIHPVLGALTATRSRLVEVLGYRCNSMTLALCRIMWELCNMLDEVDGFKALQEFWRAKIAGLTPEEADERTDDFVAEPEAIAALSGVQIPQLVDDVYDFLRELDAYEAEHEVEREFIHAAAFRINNSLPRPKPPAEEDSPNGMSRKKADLRARELALSDPSFYTVSTREQARRIGCSWATWRATPFYQQASWNRPKGGRPKPKTKREGAAPKAVGLTPSLESVTGEGRPNEVLNRLIADQEADSEPSPLEPDPPDDLPKRVHSRKRL